MTGIILIAQRVYVLRKSGEVERRMKLEVMEVGGGGNTSWSAIAHYTWQLIP